MRRLSLLVAARALHAAAANAQDLASIETAEAAVVAAWNASPLVFRTVALLAEPAQGYGIYVERENSTFSPSEPIVIYAEPAGYAWRDNGNGTHTFGFDVDLLVKTAKREIVGGQENFQQIELTSRARNREFMLTLTLTVEGAPPGDYIVEYKVRDRHSEKAGTISVPFKVAN